jgi:hypothetical protein
MVQYLLRPTFISKAAVAAGAPGDPDALFKSMTQQLRLSPQQVSKAGMCMYI